MNSIHYNIATDGIRAGHKKIAKLGVEYYTQIIIREPSSSSGGGGFYSAPEEKQRPYNPLFGVIHIEYYGKEENFVFYPVHNVPPLDIEIRKFKYTIDRDTNAIINVTLLSAVTQTITAPNITVKDKNYDSTTRIEQPRIFIERTKYDK